MDPYFLSFNYAFGSIDIKNIAVTGPYGAGKSTVIRSYLDNRAKKDHVNVSLAGFDMAKTDKEKPDDMREVELSILQQILYKVDRKELPDSRIDRINNRDADYVKSTFCNLLLFMLPLLPLLTLIFNVQLIAHFQLPKEWGDFLKSHYIAHIISVLGLSGWLLYRLTHLASRIGFFDRKLKLSKISFLSATAETQGKEPSSLLNDSLDEVIYFFSRTSYRTVVFEDLDRLDSAEIFIKLREINKIINNSRDDNDPIRFVYAVKDDIFHGADVKTKFFDYIIPIVPVLDIRNAYSILKNKIPDFPDNHLQCLRGTSLYIPDMRTLQNIVNEYHLFMPIVSAADNKDKLFSLIFYKNLFALDYNLADRKLGILYSYMHDYRVRNLHSEYFGKLDTQLDELESKLERVQSECQSTDKDVRHELMCGLLPEHLWNHWGFIKVNKNTHNRVRQYNVPASLITDEKRFIAFFSDTEVIHLGANNNQPVLILDDNLRNQIIDEYEDRVELTRESKDAIAKQTQDEITYVREQINKRNAITLSELTKLNGRAKFDELATSYIKNIDDRNILSEEQENTVLDSLKYGGLDALYYLITNAYLMQDFMMYRSIFHEGALTEDDYDYIKSVAIYTGHEQINKEFVLQNIAGVAKDLIDNSYIHRDGALHHQVVSHLMTNDKATLTEVINNLFTQSPTNILSVFTSLSSKFDDPVNFEKFITYASNRGVFQDKLLAVVEACGSVSLQTRIITTVMTQANLQLSQKKAEFKQYIENIGWQLISELETAQVEPFMNNARILGVVYTNVEEATNEAERAGAKYLADNNMYVIDSDTFSNVASAAIAQTGISPADVKNRPWALLEEYNLNTMMAYVKENINPFVRKVFLPSKDEQASVITLLNNSDIELSLKADVISQMAFTISDHHEITNNAYVESTGLKLSLHDLLYRHNRVLPQWSSFSSYMMEDCDRNVLCKYVSEHANMLCESNYNDAEFSNNEADTFLAVAYTKILCDDELNTDTYDIMSAFLHVPYTLLDENISEKNLRRLINNEQLPLTVSSFEHVLDKLNTVSNKLSFLIFWFARYQEELLTNASSYFSYTTNIESMSSLLPHAIMSETFSEAFLAKLFNELMDHTQQSRLEELDLSSGLLECILSTSHDERLKLAMITQLVHQGVDDKETLLHLLSYFDGADFKAVLTNKSVATIHTSMPEELDFLKAIEKRKLIIKFEEKGNGRVEVKMKNTFISQSILSDLL